MKSHVSNHTALFAKKDKPAVVMSAETREDIG